MCEKEEESAEGAPNQGCFPLLVSVQCYPFLDAPLLYISLFSIPSANQCSSFKAAEPEEGVKRKRERKRDIMIGTLAKKESKRKGDLERAQ
eukprot:1715749-Rhodomonas_salina.2